MHILTPMEKIDSKAHDPASIALVQKFAIRFGVPHLHFAYHAAFALSFGPRFLYVLRNNFQIDCLGKAIDWPLEVVADLLLSPLCEELGHEHYRIRASVRGYLLDCLLRHPRFGASHVKQLGDFVDAYYSQPLYQSSSPKKAMAEAQRWGAMLVLQPSEAASTFAKLIQGDSKPENPFILFRLRSLMEQFTALPEQMRELHAYVEGMVMMETGDIEKATSRLAPWQSNGLRIGEVLLKVPKLLREQPTGIFEMELAKFRIQECIQTQSTKLDLSDCGIAAVVPEELAQMEWLEALDLSENPIEDISQLRHIGQLRLLKLNETRVMDISPPFRSTSIDSAPLRQHAGAGHLTHQRTHSIAIAVPCQHAGTGHLTH
jgi:hypothetical protein